MYTTHSYYLQYFVSILAQWFSTFEEPELSPDIVRYAALALLAFGAITLLLWTAIDIYVEHKYERET